VAPIVQNQLVPVFLDNHPLTGNADLASLEVAFAPGKTKAVLLAHALGNPFDLSTWAADYEADMRTTVDTARLAGAGPFQTILKTICP